MGTIQTRLTSDNKQHDEAFRKSRQEIYNYNKRVEGAKAEIKKFAGGVSDLVGMFGKFVPAIAAVSSATSILNNTIKATQTTSDAFDITVNAMKASVDSFFVALSTGNFKTFLDGLTDVIEASKEVSKNLDELGTKQIFLDRSTADYNLLKSEKNKIIYDRNSTKEQVEAAKATLREATEEYRKEQEALAQEALKTAASMLQEAFKNTGAKVSNDTINKIVGDINLYKDWQKKYLDYEAQKRQFRINKGNALDGSGKSYWQSRIDEINNSNSYKIANGVYNTSDEKLKEANGHYINARNIQTQMINDDITQMKLEQRVDNRFNKSTTFTSTDELSDWSRTPLTPASLPPQVLDMGVKRLGDLQEEIRLTDELTEATNRYDASLQNVSDTANEQYDKLNSIFNLQLDALNSFGSALSTLGDTFDIEGLNIAGTIASAIANIIKGYSEASAQSATLGPWAWAAFSLAGLAQVTSVIAQIHSLSGYANGGIVGGNSFSGDRVMARVNSGEMILNRSQQANLFNMIGGGVSTGGNVKFRIEGDALVGVLNNYNKKTGRVR